MTEIEKILEECVNGTRLKSWHQPYNYWTLDDVNNAIKKYWQTDNMFVTIVTGQSEAAALAVSFRENRPSPMSYSGEVKNGMPEEVLEEDKAAENYKLNVKKVDIIKSSDTFKKKDEEVTL